MSHALFAPCGLPRPRRAAAILALSFVAAIPVPGAGQELTLAEARRIAVREAPLLAAQEAAVRAARETSVGAAELPDPKLIAAVESVPAEGADRFSLTRDFMTMRRIGVMQDFPRAEKRRLRGERAEAEVLRESAVLEAARLNVMRDASLAWIDAWLAERSLALLKGLEDEARLQVTAAEAALAGGRGQAADPFAARLASAQLGDRMIETSRAVARARSQLARWIPRDATRPLDAPPAFDRLDHSHEALLADLESHPHLAMYAPMRSMAEKDVRLAEAAKSPDWSLEVAYAQRGPAFTNMFSIGVRIDLPIFETRRQDPAIASRVAAAEQVRAQTEDAVRAHAAEIRTMLADWQHALERVRQFDAAQLPLSAARTHAALAAYRGGKADLAPVLEARRVEIEMRLARLQAEAELGRAWTQLDLLLPPNPAKDRS